MSYIPIVQFISTEYLRSVVPIESNVDDEKLIPHIIVAQDTHVQASIGESGYNALKNGITGNTLTSDELYLMKNFIQPLTAQYAYYYILPFLNYKSTNKAISKESSEYSTPVDLEEMKYLRNSVRDIAEFYQRRLVKYLLDYPSLFTWYSSPNTKDNLNKTTQAYFSGVYSPYPGNTGTRNIPVYTEPYGTLYPCGFPPCN